MDSREVNQKMLRRTFSRMRSIIGTGRKMKTEQHDYWFGTHIGC